MGVTPLFNWALLPVWRSLLVILALSRHLPPPQVVYFFRQPNALFHSVGRLKLTLNGNFQPARIRPNSLLLTVLCQTLFCCLRALVVILFGTLSWGETMTPASEIIFAIGLFLGCALGYSTRAFISYRRHRAARQRYCSI